MCRVPAAANLYAAAPAVGVRVPWLAGAGLPDHERVEVESELAHLQQARGHVATRGVAALTSVPALHTLIWQGEAGAVPELK